MHQYRDLVEELLNSGTPKGDRTGTGTLSKFGHQMRFDLSGGKWPVVTLKKTNLKPVIHELLWFLSGSTNVRDLNKHGVHIWDEWADANGSLGPIYGEQWRSWVGRDYAHDQIRIAENQIRDNPDSRRIIVSAWNVDDISLMNLPPCHVLFQFYVADGKLSCQLYQRSADVFLGVPFNIASYSLLTHMLACSTGLEPGEFIWTGGDVHLYRNHVRQAGEMVQRVPYPAPLVQFSRCPRSVVDFRHEDIEAVNYRHHPAIKAPVAV